MKRSERHIVAIGGGSFRTDPGNLLDDLLLSLTAVSRPRVCLIPTASGDPDPVIEAFHRSFIERHCTPSVLRLFNREVTDVEGFLLDQDLIFVGGGNTLNMMAIWRLHGVEAAIRKAWQQGIVLAGVSAGGLCWFEEGVTDSYHVTDLKPIRGLLGILAGSFCPHYNSEENRRPTYHGLIGAGTLAPGYAADDGVGLHYVNEQLLEAVSFKEGASAWRLERGPDGTAIEIPFPTRLLA
jgi:peptidase E